jgi:1-acyl-sn-glycerol-3-phosphate acyltransferase
MNHESALDIPIMMAALPLRIRFMAKKELFKIPLFGWIINLARHIPIDREHPRRAISTINKVSRELIHQNYCIVVSPEGRRSYDGRIAPFKKGAFKLAERYKLPILPVLILGARHCVPNKKISIVPGSVEVYIEPEVQIDSYPNLTACVEDLHQRMSTQKERYENNRNRGSHA